MVEMGFVIATDGCSVVRSKNRRESIRRTCCSSSSGEKPGTDKTEATKTNFNKMGTKFAAAALGVGCAISLYGSQPVGLTAYALDDADASGAAVAVEQEMPSTPSDTMQDMLNDDVKYAPVRVAPLSETVEEPEPERLVKNDDEAFEAVQKAFGWKKKMVLAAGQVDDGSVVVEVSKDFRKLSPKKQASLTEAALTELKPLGYTAIQVLETESATKLTAAGLKVRFGEDARMLATENRKLQKEIDAEKSAVAKEAARVEQLNLEMKQLEARKEANEVESRRLLSIEEMQLEKIEEDMGSLRAEIIDSSNRKALEKEVAAVAANSKEYDTARKIIEFESRKALGRLDDAKKQLASVEEQMRAMGKARADAEQTGEKRLQKVSETAEVMIVEAVSNEKAARAELLKERDERIQELEKQLQTTENQQVSQVSSLQDKLKSQLDQQKSEGEKRITQVRKEKEAKEREEQRLKEEEERKIREEEERKIKEEERRIREEEEQKRKAEEEQRRKEEQERKQKEEEERKLKEEEQRKVKEEEERKQKEEEERKQKEEEERKKKEEEERKKKEEEDRKKEEKQKKKEEAERKKKEEEERKLKEQEERKLKEQEERQLKEQEERKLKELEERKLKELEERRLKELEERKLKEQESATSD